MAVYVSTSCVSHESSYAQRLELLTQHGIRNVELGICHDRSMDAQEIASDPRFSFIVHHYFPPPEEDIIINLASSDDSLRETSIVQMQRSIQFCAAHDIPLFTFHAGFRADPDKNFRFDPESAQEYESAYHRFRDAVKQIATRAEEHGVVIGVEHNVLADYNLINGKNELLLMCEATELQRLFDDIDSPALGLLLDLGHLKVTARSLDFDPEAFIASLRERVVAIHVHENDGRRDEHRCPVERDWSLDMLRRYFQNTDIPVILEGKPVTPSILPDTVSLIGSCIGTMDFELTQ